MPDPRDPEEGSLHLSGWLADELQAYGLCREVAGRSGVVFEVERRAVPEQSTLQGESGKS